MGEASRRIIAKAILSVLKYDVLDTTGVTQLCTGQIDGVEAAVHAVRHMINDEKTEAVLLVDASNAFNALNRKVAMHNLLSVCPPFANQLSIAVEIMPI